MFCLVLQVVPEAELQCVINRFLYKGIAGMMLLVIVNED